MRGIQPSQRPVSFAVFFHLGPNKRLNKQSRGWLFKTPVRSLWRHCDDIHAHNFSSSNDNLGVANDAPMVYKTMCSLFSFAGHINAVSVKAIIVRRAGLLWSQQDFEWRWSVPLFKCLTVLEFSFILFDLCLLITFFNFIMNYVPIVTFWIFTYHNIWILSIMFSFIWSYWIIYFLACLEVSWRVVS